MRLSDKARQRVRLAGAYIISISLVGTALGLLYLRLEPLPIHGYELVRALPEDRILDRRQQEAALLTRRICTTRPTGVEVHRQWLDEAGGVLPVMHDYYHLDFTGCRELPPFKIYPPSMLGEGKHTYRVRLHWCNPMKCETVPGVVDADYTIVGHTVPGNEPRRDGSVPRGAVNPRE